MDVWASFGSFYIFRARMGQILRPDYPRLRIAKLHAGRDRISGHAGLMASDPTRVLMRQLMGAVAEYDKKGFRTARFENGHISGCGSCPDSMRLKITRSAV